MSSLTLALADEQVSPLFGSTPTLLLVVDVLFCGVEDEGEQKRNKPVGIEWGRP
jgi:hypothetical protein